MSCQHAPARRRRAAIPSPDVASLRSGSIGPWRACNAVLTHPASRDRASCTPPRTLHCRKRSAGWARRRARKERARFRRNPPAPARPEVRRG